VPAEDEEEDPESAKAARKAARRAAKEAAAAEPADEEEDPEAAKAARKAAKKAAKAAAAAAAAEEDAAAEDAQPAKKARSEEEEKVAAPAAEEAEAKGQGEIKTKGRPNNKELEIFIGGLPFSTTQEVLRKDFEECGEIIAFRMPLNDEGGCRGVAFCEYATKEGVDSALKFNQTDYGGRSIVVRMSNDDNKGKGKGKDGKGKGNKEFEIFVGGLPFSTTEEALKKDFAECGEIVNFRMPLNEEGKARGIAFIEFKDKEACDKVLAFHETDYGGRTITVKMSSEGAKGDKGKGDKGKGDKGKGKGKKGKKGKAPSEAQAKSSGCIVEGTGAKKTFDSDTE